jgi:site-specific recombinase XerD
MAKSHLRLVRPRTVNGTVPPRRRKNAELEMRALRELKRFATSAFVFTSERGAPFATAGFAKMVARVGEAAKLKSVHPHMLRHACGYALANRGHDTRALQAYLGHKNIQHTVRYTELSPMRFKDFWR